MAFTGDLTTFNKIYPLYVDKFESLIPIENMSVTDKINSVIQHLNRVGKLSNDAIKDWNSVMKWLMEDGLGESVNEKVDQLIADGKFDELLQGMNDEINAGVDLKLNGFETQLSDIVKLSSFTRQGGETDDTGLLQRAINYAQQNKKLLLNGDSSKVYTISSPIYIGSYVRADFGNATIKKTTNTVGTGSNSIGVTPDSYLVDACFILTHLDNDDNNHTELKNIIFDSSAPSKIKYGIYAPRFSRSSIDNILFGYGKFDYGVYGFTWWMIHSLSNIRSDSGIATFEIADDGTHTGGSTSINATQIGGTENQNCIKLYGVSYSTFTNCLVDYCQDIPFYVSLCEGLTFNSPSTEYAQTGKFAYIEASNVVMNTPRAHATKGVTSGSATLIDIQGGSKVTINSGVFSDYTSGTPSMNLLFVTAGGSMVTLNNTKLPTNGNTYDPLTSNSIKYTIDERGITANKLNGSTMIISLIDGKSIGYATSPPTDGTWKLADRILNWNPTVGQPKSWVCTVGGTPGTWVSEGNL